MKIFFVNLARRPERREFMERQFDAFGIDAERVEAIDGRAMAPMEREKAISRFRWWCANGYRARDGEIGCALSHQSIYRRMVAEDIPYACILEDDVTLDPRFAEMMAACGKFITETPSAKVLILTPYKGRESRDVSVPCFDRTSSAASTGGYVINCEAAKRLIEVNTPLHTTIDKWGRLCRLGRIELYDASPVVCHQSEYRFKPKSPAFASDTIDSDTVFVSDMSPYRRLAHKAMRCIGVVIDRIIR